MAALIGDLILLAALLAWLGGKLKPETASLNAAGQESRLPGRSGRLKVVGTLQPREQLGHLDAERVADPCERPDRSRVLTQLDLRQLGRGQIRAIGKLSQC